MCIHEAIDECRRNVLWLNVSTPNKDPAVISKYFLNFVCKTNRSARVARPGRGVKNCIIAGIQKYFDRGGNQKNCFFLPLFIRRDLGAAHLVVGTKKS